MSARSFETIEKAYRELTPALVRFASTHLFNSDYALDAVHDAFIKIQEYVNKNPGRKILTRLVYWKVLIACKKYNRFSNETEFKDNENQEVEVETEE